MHLAGARDVTRLLQRESVVVQPFGVVRAALDVGLSYPWNSGPISGKYK